MTERPTERELALVAQHSHTDLIRSLAAIQLARRRHRLDELQELIE